MVAPVFSDPRLLSSEPFVPHAFADLMAVRALLPEYTEERYARSVARFQALQDVSIQRIRYQVDGLAVSGITVMPSPVTPAAHPLLIYNRGGCGEFAKLTVGQLLWLPVRFAQAGYLVFASNYRGNDGGEGREEFGGSDVNDVLELLDIARHHPGWDGKNAFMFGGSRGAMMTYLAIAQGAKLNAAAAMCGPSDLVRGGMERPSMRENVYRRFIPNFDNDSEAACAARSAILWPERLTVPLLLLHGSEDDRVAVSHTERLSAALDHHGISHKTVIYPGDDHHLSRNTNAVIEEIRDWYAIHRLD